MTIGACISGKFNLVRPGVLEHWCAGCCAKHTIDVHARNGDGCLLGWDGDSRDPSIAETVRHETPRGACEYLLRGGVQYFLESCWHPLAGKSRHLEACPK